MLSTACLHSDCLTLSILLVIQDDGMGAQLPRFFVASVCFFPSIKKLQLLLCMQQALLLIF